MSFREVEELMLQRGVVVSYETIRQWCAKFGPVYANRLRRRRDQPGDTWHLDEFLNEINATIDLSRAVDEHQHTMCDVRVAVAPKHVGSHEVLPPMLKGLR